MKRNGQLSRVLHILMHLSLRKGPATSADLARSIDANAVVVRQIMAGLREHGYVKSSKGHGGGWVLSCDPSKVSLRDIYNALGCPPLLALESPAPTAECRVAQSVNAVLSRSYQEAEIALLTGLGRVTLADLSADLRTRLHP
ncbi:transcriptional regulator [bacterium SCN 62-11]|nr:Rrf2 family transcriptional regulator [Candidatus Eremiobacteraeota bacterium]ODT58724.1 MAG: transcriptional regulator [bacterium SCN 62-11]